MRNSRIYHILTKIQLWYAYSEYTSYKDNHDGLGLTLNVVVYSWKKLYSDFIYTTFYVDEPKLFITA